jgi:hypothetical protein
MSRRWHRGVVAVLVLWLLVPSALTAQGNHLIKRAAAVEYSAQPAALSIAEPTSSPRLQFALCQQSPAAAGDPLSAWDAAGFEAVYEAPAEVGAQEVTQFVNQDSDGIDDDLEQVLADEIAPLVFIDADESTYPVNVERFPQRVHLQYHENCTFDVDLKVGPNSLNSPVDLIGPPRLKHAHRGEGDTGYTHPPPSRSDLHCDGQAISIFSRPGGLVRSAVFAFQKGVVP